MDVQHFENIAEDDSMRLKTGNMSEIEISADRNAEKNTSRMLVAILAFCLIIIVMLLACLVLLVKDYSKPRTSEKISGTDVARMAPTDMTLMAVSGRESGTSASMKSTGIAATGAPTTSMALTMREMTNCRQDMPNKNAFCRVAYKGKCFWGIFGGQGSTDLPKANFYCSQYGARLAGVYSVEHYNMLLPMLREQLRFDPDGALNAWIGMEKQKGSQVSFLNGSLALYMDGLWGSGYPTTDNPASTDLTINVGDSGNHGIVNTEGTATNFGGICEM